MPRGAGVDVPFGLPVRSAAHSDGTGVRLSHDLLFMYKQPAEFGANFWNGVYYQLRIEDGVIKGNAQAVDLNMLASPPDDLSILPFGEWDREELEPKNRWLPFIEIR